MRFVCWNGLTKQEGWPPVICTSFA